ncbi:putative pectinesterase/pectinesterase inhibitor 45 [Typha latifolia]|uniref:putative pectinesterase/pectinesterase inhibitor 45 n=1 Tax=Typha latifolia TaxID=4733 RepID=UPI003C2F3BF1
MSAFQDFGPLSERRKAEKQQKQRRRLIIVGVSASVLLIICVIGIVSIIYHSKQNAATQPSATSLVTDGLHSVSKYIDMICSPTDYKDACKKSISKATNSSSSPKDLISASVSVIGDEIGKAFEHSDLIKSDDPRVKAAVKDCRELYGYSKDELLRTLQDIDAHKLDQLPDKSHQLRVWLSAVITYQETCIEGFPDGELKTKMRNAMTAGKHLTSNALAIIQKASSFLSSLNIPGFSRRLLPEEAMEPVIRKDGFPSWVSDTDRRLLKGSYKNNLKPNVVVAKDGSGDFTTISAAIDAVPSKYTGRYVIHVKEGVYDEQVIVPRKAVNITMYGDGARKTVVTGNKNFIDGTTTYKSATFAVMGDGFMAIAMGFRNTAGAIKHQAVALRVQSDRSVFLNCRMDGYQDTLYAHSMSQFYRNCIISGTIDFIFGDAAAVFQNCVLVVRRPLDNQQNIVTAQGRADGQEATGFVLQHCRIIPDGKLVPDKLRIRSYLGRPWREYSHTIIMETDIGDFISRDGYLPWSGDFGLKTLSYSEYKNKGAGASTSARVRWPGFKVITNPTEANKYTVTAFLNGNAWIKAMRAPVRLGLYR